MKAVVLRRADRSIYGGRWRAQTSGGRWGLEGWKAGGLGAVVAKGLAVG